MLIIAKIPLKKWLFSSSIFAAVIAIGSFLDFIFYNEFVIAPLNYLHLNLVAGMASYFGTEPWYYYITQFILVGFLLISIPILLFFMKGLIPLKKHLFTWAILPFILIHFLIAHKEMRFLFPIIYPFLFISFYGFFSYFEKKKVKSYHRIFGKIAVGINLLILLIIILMPSNEMIHNYKYMYMHMEEGDNRIMSIDKNFNYKMAGLKASFYTPENVISDCVESIEGMEAYLYEHNIQKCFLLYQKYDFDTTLEEYSVKRVFSVYPDWLTSIDGVDWQSTLQTYSVFIIEKNE
jgi:phosphatidylinositol glycan class B